MGAQYSDWYALAQPGIAIATPRIKIPWGVNNRHYKRATVSLNFAAPIFAVADIARVMTFRSSDRLSALFITNIGATAGAVDVGFYASGANNDGPLVDVNRIAAAKSLAGTLDRIDTFALGGGDVVKTDRGKAIWELLGLAADPVLEYDLTLVATTTITIANAVVVVEANGAFS